MRKVPKLRFKEFSDEWKEKKLGEINDNNIKWSFTGGPFGSDLKSEDYTLEGIRIIQLQNIGDGKFIDESKIYTSLEKANELLSCNIFPHEILISKMGNPVARALIVPSIEKRYLMCSDGIRLVANQEKYNSKFIMETINNNDFRTKAENISTGSTRKRIGLSELKKLSLNIPSLKEQEKIANFLSSIDKKISLTEEKLELFREYKKGVMQKIFSQELRFKDSNGNDYPEWEEKRLGEILTSKSSAISQNTLKNNEGIYSVYGAIGKIKNINFYENENEYIGIVKDGAGVGRTFLCEKKSSVLGTLNYLELKTKSIYLKFAYYILKQIDFSKYIVGSSIPHIYFKDYKNEKIQLPILEEQQKIADFLSSIDSKIESIEKELEGLREFKRGLLQQMFV